MRRWVSMLLLLFIALPGLALAEPPLDTTEGVPGAPAELKVANRSVIVLHATLLGKPRKCACSAPRR